MSEQIREEMEVDVLFVGAGIANLSAAYALMQHIEKHNAEAESTGLQPIEEPVILVIDKGSKPGSHILSGAVVDPKAFRELFPELAVEELPFTTAVKEDSVHYLTGSGDFTVPHSFLPQEMKSNHGCYLASLAETTQWMAAKCEEAGIEVYTEFSGQELLYDDGKVIGVRLGDTGRDHGGNEGESFTPGMDVFAKVTVLGEGTCGHLSQKLIEQHQLGSATNPQVWALGIKEIVRIPEGRVEPGQVVHTFGYPLAADNYGGSFIYAYDKDLVGIGLVIGLDYTDPYLNVHEAFLKFKSHPIVANIIQDGEVVEYGAKTLPEGGYFAIPRLSVDGAMLVGDSAGMLNAMRLKGIHLAMKSGMLAAEKIIAAMVKDSFTAADLDYRQELDGSWAGEELYATRNYRQGFHGGLIPGMINTGLYMVSGGKIPGGQKSIEADYTRMKKASSAKPAEKIKTDKKLYLDVMSDVYLSGTLHREDEPSHISFKNQEKIFEDNKLYDSPSTRFCPADVYEKKTDDDGKFDGIQINFSNCLHCKTCVIKDPLQNITWVPPEGGEGPKYKKM